MPFRPPNLSSNSATSSSAASTASGTPNDSSNKSQSGVGAAALRKGGGVAGGSGEGSRSGAGEQTWALRSSTAARRATPAAVWASSSSLSPGPRSSHGMLLVNSCCHVRSKAAKIRTDAWCASGSESLSTRMAARRTRPLSSGSMTFCHAPVDSNCGVASTQVRASRPRIMGSNTTACSPHFALYQRKAVAVACWTCTRLRRACCTRSCQASAFSCTSTSQRYLNFTSNWFKIRALRWRCTLLLFSLRSSMLARNSPQRSAKASASSGNQRISDNSTSWKAPTKGSPAWNHLAHAIATSRPVLRSTSTAE
mmetsp:Transcript_122591/g.392356  ORF Transcript_122591/g.392356 Transcript_122591/m.392356 type:complete len:310 (+) Transcript_122591:2397-3326(+)